MSPVQMHWIWRKQCVFSLIQPLYAQQAWNNLRVWSHLQCSQKVFRLNVFHCFEFSSASFGLQWNWLSFKCWLLDLKTFDAAKSSTVFCSYHFYTYSSNLCSGTMILNIQKRQTRCILDQKSNVFLNYHVSHLLRTNQKQVKSEDGCCTDQEEHHQGRFAREEKCLWAVI